MTRTIRSLAAAAALTLAAGCAGYGWDDVLSGAPGSASQVTGTVERVDSRSRVLDLRDERGHPVRLRYDGNTRVTYRGREYRPTSLERGDLVTVRLSRDRRGDLYARQVVLRRDARDRYGRTDERQPTGRQTLDGQVARVDRGGGRFQLRTGGRSVWVTLPYRPSGSVERRFRDLRQGDRVRVEGRWLGDQRFELERFR